MKNNCQRFLVIALSIAGLMAADANAYDKSYIGEMVYYRAAYEDTFVHLARDYNLGFVEIRAANPGVDPWIPGEGKELILPTRHLLPDAPKEGVVINLPEMRLYVYQDDKDPISFPIGIGREGLDTPLGTTKVIGKKQGPTWRPTPRMRQEDPDLPAVVEPGPENPLGTHALYLGWPQYAMHGTNRPFGIGRRISSGCIRLYPEDIVQLFDLIPVGTKVTVVDQPIKVAWIENELYLEAHPTVAQSAEIEEEGEVSNPSLSEEGYKMIVQAAGSDAENVDWDLVRDAVHARKGYPVRIAKRWTSATNETEVEKSSSEAQDAKNILKANTEGPEDSEDVIDLAENENAEMQDTATPIKYKTLNP